MSLYVVITAGPDGVGIYTHDRDTLVKALNDEDWGDTEWLSAMPEESDPNCWQSRAGVQMRDVGVIISGGAVVVPKPKEQVVSWTI